VISGPWVTTSAKPVKASRGRHIHAMEKTVGRVLSIMMIAVMANAAALRLAYVAHFDFVLSGDEIRFFAVIAVSVITALVVMNFSARNCASSSN
jgi:hypothetical protein